MTKSFALSRFHSKLLVGTAALALSGGVFFGLGLNSGGPQSEAYPAMVDIFDPVTFAKGLCNRPTDAAFRSRRDTFVRAGEAYAATMAEEQDSLVVDIAPPLFEGMGDFSYKISTDNPQAQAYFDQGLRFALNFNHAEAVRAFLYAQTLDPECAMCYWGEALVLGPNINAPMDAQAWSPAYKAAKKALALGNNGTKTEKVLIDAIQKRYRAQPMADRSSLDKAYADAMFDAAAQFPDDDFVLVNAVEAGMDTQPWVYWQADGITPIGHTAKIVELLETVLARRPDHPGAIHLYIHMTESSADPYRAEKPADRLSALMPAAGHLVHMPSHTYFKVGRFVDSLNTNVKAVAADEAFIGSNQASPIYQYGYYTHNIHFVLTSAQMAGDKETALAMAAKLDQELPMEMAAAVPIAQPVKVAPYFALVQFNQNATILDLEDPGAELPYVQAIWHYARGEAFARLGQADAAKAEVEKIKALRSHKGIKELEKNAIPAGDILNVASTVIEARVALVSGDHDGAISLLEKAVKLQDDLAYMEPPYWYAPLRQSLGAALLKAGNPRRAEQVLFQALLDSPNNGWAYWGLEQAYKDMGQSRAASYYGRLFKRSWIGNKSEMALNLL